MKRGFLERDGVRLAYADFGGEGPGLLLLHGIYGCATTWLETSRWLTPHFRVVGLDLRGHGLSDKPDDGYSLPEFVGDAASAIEQLHLGPAITIGHSMGALIGWSLAATRPELVRALVLEDMTAATAGLNRREWVHRWMGRLPLPFPSLAAVRTFFDNFRPGLGDYFVEIMTESPDGYRPVWQVEHMAKMGAMMDERDYWSELEQVRCPTLVVKGGDSENPRFVLQEMARRLQKGQYIEVAGANHVVHYDQPAGWRAAVEPFVLSQKST